MTAPPPGESTLPSDNKARKLFPLATGVIDYFPDALIAIAELSRIGNDQHNPGQPLHWARGKGGNNADELARHFVQRGTIDNDKVRHSTKVAWRALAILQLELEAAHVVSDLVCEARAFFITTTGNDRQVWQCAKCRASWEHGEPRPCETKALVKL